MVFILYGRMVYWKELLISKARRVICLINGDEVLSDMFNNLLRIKNPRLRNFET